jgi:hypothetical protein
MIKVLLNIAVAFACFAVPAALADLLDGPPSAYNRSAPVTNFLTANVTMSSGSTYYDGALAAVPGSGTWYVSATNTLVDSAGAASMFCKLWDGFTLMNSAGGHTVGAGDAIAMTVTGILANPKGALRLSCEDSGSTTGTIAYNNTSNGQDSNITAYRIK